MRFSPDIFRTQTYGGVSRYVSELHRGLARRGVDSKVVAGLHINSYLHGLPGVHGVDIERIRPLPARQALSKVTDRALERLWCSRLDEHAIWHKTMFDRWVPDRNHPKLAVTVYDMIHERFPDQFGPRDVIPSSKRPWCEAADIVFAISSTTRDDLLERFDLAPEKVVVTPLGVTTVEPRPGPLPFDESPWLLYVGERAKPYKNWRTLIDAVAATDVDIRLACFGPPRTPEELHLLDARGLRGRVAFVGGDDRDLAHAYRSASALVYPSLHEGFGLPPLEAMSHGCPVIAARSGPLPEILGDAAIFFDPTDVEDLVHAIASAISPDAGLTALTTRARQHAAEFTWQRTVDATLRGYREIAG